MRLLSHKFYACCPLTNTSQKSNFEASGSINVPTKAISPKKDTNTILNGVRNASIAISVLLGCSLMTTGRREDLLDGIAIAAGGTALTTLFLGLFNVAKKQTTVGKKHLTTALSLAVLAGLSLKLSNSLEPSQATSTTPSSLSIPGPVYETWFKANKGIIDQLKTMEAPGPALGALQGMALLEPHMMVRSGWYEQARFSGNPKNYGFDTIENTMSEKHPVLLLPGAIGTWNYLGDLARSLKQAGIPVFTIDTGAGATSDDKLKRVNKKILEIRTLYQNSTSVDIVAHSMGANLALAVAYDEASVFIDAEGNLAFREDKPLEANPLVRKIITLANPLIKSEVESLKQIEKIDHFFNIIAKYDGIMGHKQPGLVGDVAHQAEEVENGHIGIVFDSEVHQKIIHKLSTV